MSDINFEPKDLSKQLTLKAKAGEEVLIHFKNGTVRGIFYEKEPSYYTAFPGAEPVLDSVIDNPCSDDFK